MQDDAFTGIAVLIGENVMDWLDVLLIQKEGQVKLVTDDEQKVLPEFSVVVNSRVEITLKESTKIQRFPPEKLIWWQLLVISRMVL